MSNSTKVINQAMGNNWAMYNGDCVEVIKGIPDNSVHLSIFSPPFSNLYTYSDSMADMGNTVDDFEFFEHFAMLVPELFRITKPGRLVAIHCKDLPAYMNRDGYAGLRDFAGEIIRMMELYNLVSITPPNLEGLSPIEAYQSITKWQRDTEAKKPETAGFRFHSRFNVWKDPVIEMQRTKNHGLLHKNFTERGEAVRQGMADYVLVFRKWPLDEAGESVLHNLKVGDWIGEDAPKEWEYTRGGDNPDKMNRLYSIASWQRLASPAWNIDIPPVWMDIDQTDVLNYKVAKANEDEKHIAPLQLGLIERCIQLWTNEGETVFSPFGGIGSEPYVAVKMKRKGVAIELKPEYYQWAIKNLQEAERQAGQKTLFNLMDEMESKS
jgi:DNA modification methylase